MARCSLLEPVCACDFGGALGRLGAEKTYTRPMPPHFFTPTFSAQNKTGACAACAASFGPADPAAHFYGELRSVAEQVVPQLKRQAQERRAEERRRSPAGSICGKLRSVAAEAQVFSEAPFIMAVTS